MEKKNQQVVLADSGLQQASIWWAWLNKKCRQIKAGTRKGVPRGEKIPFGPEKILAALLTTLYPRGLKTTAELGEKLGVSGELIRKWRREKDFRAFVQELEVDFAQHVLSSLADKDFLVWLLNSPYEPFSWSNNILEIFYLELANSLSTEVRQDGDRKAQLKSHLENKFSQVSNYIPFQSILELPQDSDPDFFLYNLLLRDLGQAAIKAIKSRGGKRGKKPYEDVKMRTVAMLDEFNWQPVSELRSCLNSIEEGLKTGQHKDDLLRLVEQANYIINIAFSEKEKEEKSALTT
jgi:hypothetical protein